MFSLRIYATAILIAMISILSPFIDTFPQTQPEFEWSPQQRIPIYEDATEEPPFLISDGHLPVHAFNSQPIDLNNPSSQKAVYYRQWSPDSGWSSPNDIFYDQNGGNLELIGVYLDHQPVVHILYQLGNGDINYSSSPLSQAGNASNWLKPVQIAENSVGIRPGINYIGAISGNDNGILVAIFSGVRDGNGLYMNYSQDGGRSWNKPIPLYLSDNPEYTVVTPSMFCGDENQMHIVFSTFDEHGLGGPGYYSRIDLTSMNWTVPTAIDTPGIRTPSVIEFHGEVIISYYHHNVNGNWWRKSTASAREWTKPARISENLVGTNGALSFAIDGQDMLHAFFGQRINPNPHGLWHVIYEGDTWSYPDAVVSGPLIEDEVGGNGFDPRSARAIIPNGNTILVTWGTDGAAGQNGAWYSQKKLNIPKTSIITHTQGDSITAIPTKVIYELKQVTPTIAVKPIQKIIDKEQPGLLKPQVPIFISVIISLSMITLVIIIRKLFSMRS